MAKTITEQQITDFREACEAAVEEDGYLTIESLPEEFQTEEWEFHAANYNPEDTHDFYELFEKVSDQYTLEEEGYGSFFVSRTSKSH